QTPLSSAVGGSHVAVAQLLIKAGAKDVDAALVAATAAGNVKMAQAILDSAKVSQAALDAALYLTVGGTNKEMKAALERAGAKPLPPAPEQNRKEWTKLAGSYDSDGGQRL